MNTASSEKLPIVALDTISPSLAELLRLCRLRAGLSRNSGTQPFVLGNPRAWLGSAYHEVLAAVSISKMNNLDAIIASSWEKAVRIQYGRAQAHPLNRRFGPPETWPGYFLVLAMVKIRAKYIVDNARRGQVSDNMAGQLPKEVHEHQLIGASGKITGRPDVVYSDCIVDFKTGSLYEEGNPDSIKKSYIRQLRLYAFLVNETSGRWPKKGIVLPMAGSPVDIDLDPEECKKEAAIAIEMLSEYNSILSQVKDVSELATASPSSCRWCSYQLFCDSFWLAANANWFNELGMAAIEGIVSDSPQTIYGGAAVSLSINVQKGTSEVSSTIIAPLRTDIHPISGQIRQGDLVRVIGLQQRPDQTLSVSLRTVIAPLNGLPNIAIENKSH